MLHTWQRVWMYEDMSSQGARILMRGIAEGLRANGHEVHVFEVNHLDAAVRARMKHDLVTYDPDVIFLANHPLQYTLQQIGLDAVDCPVFVWLFDDPLIMGREKFLKNETVLAADPSFIKGAKLRGAERVLFVPVAASEDCDVVFKKEYAFPVVYAGSVFVDQAMRKKIEPRLLPVVRGLIQQKLKQPQHTFEELLASINPKKLMNLHGNVTVDIQLSHELKHFMYTECNRNWRLQFLKALEPAGLHLFGNAAWKPYIKGTPLAERFHRPIDAFTEYPKLIFSADIVININSLQGFITPTLRDFQVPRYGGFQLAAVIQPHPTDWHQHDPMNVFQLESFPWSVSSDTPEGLFEQTQKYVVNAKERRDWMQHASEVINKHHTFPHRMAQLQNVLNSKTS